MSSMYYVFSCIRCGKEVKLPYLQEPSVMIRDLFGRGTSCLCPKCQTAFIKWVKRHGHVSDKPEKRR